MQSVLKHPISRNYRGIEFKHAFQPVICASERKVYGYEALLRGPQAEPPWYIFERLETRNKPAFEQLINLCAIEYSRRLNNSGYLFLNVTSEYLIEDKGEYLIELSRRGTNPLRPSDVILEISESSSPKIKLLTNVLNRLRSAGFNIALDDFGAGYAGLNVLVDINPDLIKLDMHLIRSIHESGMRQAVLHSILAFCEAVGILVLAEGVETEEEYRFLRSKGIDLFQGFLFAKPKVDFLNTTYSHPLSGG